MRQLRLADFVAGEIERDLLVVARDRENFLEDGLEARLLALAGSAHPVLQELHVGVESEFR